MLGLFGARPEKTPKTRFDLSLAARALLRARPRFQKGGPVRLAAAIYSAMVDKDILENCVTGPIAWKISSATFRTTAL
jgi:hypothetical protein